VEALAGSSRLTNLRRLDLNETPLTPAAVKALTRASWAPQLTHLDLTNCELTNEAVQLLAGSPSLGNLRSLRLGRNPFGAPGAEALAASPHLTRLRALDLSGAPVGNDGGVTAIARSATFARLEHLDLRSVHLRQSGAMALAKSRHLRRLGSLLVYQIDWIFPEAAARALRERFGDRVVTH
jgi:Leucine Rich repeat